VRPQCVGVHLAHGGREARAVGGQQADGRELRMHAHRLTARHRARALFQTASAGTCGEGASGATTSPPAPEPEQWWVQLRQQLPPLPSAATAAAATSDVTGMAGAAAAAAASYASAAAAPAPSAAAAATPASVNATVTANSPGAAADSTSPPSSAGSNDLDCTVCRDRAQDCLLDCAHFCSYMQRACTAAMPYVPHHTSRSARPSASSSCALSCGPETILQLFKVRTVPKLSCS